MAGNSNSPHARITYLLIFTLCISFFSFELYAKSDKNKYGYGKDNTSHHNLERGRRLFYGLVKPANGDIVNCASCHNTVYSDTLNWNPSAYEIALKIYGYDNEQLAGVLMSPFTKKLMEDHAGINLTPEEVDFIKMYLNEIRHEGLEKPKPKIGRILLFVIMFLVFGWAISDLLVMRKVEKKYVHAIVLLVTTLWMMKELSHEAIAIGRSQDYAPAQPIKFSHQIHATENQMDCQYCHHTAEESKSAGIPSASLCLNCHTLVREGTNSGRHEINKIISAVDSLHPIEWVRIHRLPDFVFFSHAQHVGAGKLDCAECHGAVEEMHVVKQENDLSMGWCLDCHRTKKVDFLENDYYGMTFKEYHDKVKSGEIDSVTVSMVGGDNCMKCHY